MDKDRYNLAEVKSLLELKGLPALNMAKEAILAENIISRKVKKAIDYFLGYWQDLARPALITICCESVGGSIDVATPFAASITLMCGAIDIHDDIIDRSKRKMSRLTVLGKFGRDVALLVGDALLFESFFLLHKACKNIEMEKIERINRVISNMFFELGNAEALELGFSGKMGIKPMEYLSLVNMKAADVEACARIGAIVGNGSDLEIDALGRYGRLLGSIMILRDDLADVADYEEISNRIKHESLPLPILLAVQNVEVKDKVNSIISKKKIGGKDIKEILDIIQKIGAERKVTQLIKEMHSKANSAIEKIPKKEELKLLAYAAAFL
ncbi:MAG: class 1 isoprenoid biosynthesis enzyme [Candidatus Bathyarchaeia archaeon]